MSNRARSAIVPMPRLPLGRLEVVAERAHDYAAAAKAPNTVRAYASDWRDFLNWCSSAGLDPLPAAGTTVALYLTSLAGMLKASTLQRRLSAISQAHQVAGLETPTRNAMVMLVWAGIRRTHGSAQEGKAPALVDDLRAMVSAMAPRRRGQPWQLLDLRDRALLLLGFAGAFRRSELVALDVEDLAFSRAGLAVHLRRSKTDQEGEGRRIGIPRGQQSETCPVAALQAYLKAAGIETGAVFRGTNHGRIQQSRLSDQTVALVVKRRAEAVGLDPDHLAGHSLRAGLATSAAAAGASERAIMAQTGHKSVTMVRRYIREGELFRPDNAAAVVGL